MTTKTLKPAPTCSKCNLPLKAVGGRRISIPQTDPNATTKPWMDQVCAGAVCRECQSPLQFPASFDILYDDGREAHLGILPVPAGCINPDCKNHIKSANIPGIEKKRDAVLNRMLKTPPNPKKQKKG